MKFPGGMNRLWNCAPKTQFIMQRHNIAGKEDQKDYTDAQVCHRPWSEDQGSIRLYRPLSVPTSQEDQNSGTAQQYHSQSYSTAQIKWIKPKNYTTEAYRKHFLYATPEQGCTSGRHQKENDKCGKRRQHEFCLISPDAFCTDTRPASASCCRASPASQGSVLRLPCAR